MIEAIKNQAQNWLSKRKNQPVLGNWHVEFILHLARNLRPRTYVELGLYKCELFNRMIPLAETLIGVDMAVEPGVHMRKISKARFVNLSTDEFCQVAKDEGIEIDLLFIDANHSYESVKSDFLGFFPLVKEGGVIVLHDGYPKDLNHTEIGYCGDGYRAIDELTRGAQGYEMMTIPVHPGLTLARKRLNHLPW
jgi:hypothetical protein